MRETITTAPTGPPDHAMHCTGTFSALSTPCHGLRLITKYCVCAFGLLWAFATAVAGTTVVPDDFPSIQLAIDSGADSILIRAGIYSETPVADRGVALLGLGGRPVLAGLTITNPNGDLARVWTVNDLHIAGPLHMITGNPDARNITVRFSRCEMDSGLRHVVNTDPFDIDLLMVSDCRVRSSSFARAASIFIEADTIDAGVSLRAADTLRVRRSSFTGGSGTALEIRGSLLVAEIVENDITGYDAGIYGSELDYGSRITSNVIAEIAGTAIELDGTESIVLTGNQIRDVGVGLDLNASEVIASENTILRCSDDGMVFSGPYDLRLSRNVIGHCGSVGVAVSGGFRGRLSFDNNTIFKNGRSGVDLLDSFENTMIVHNNLVAYNGLWGMRLDEAKISVDSSCNDWFANDSGAVIGAPLGASDMQLVPLFCDVDSGDVRLSSKSPLLGTACGVIGAKGTGCGVTSTTLRMFALAVVDDAVRAEWSFESPTLQGWIERSGDGGGNWLTLTGDYHHERDRVSFVDRPPGEGTLYSYRVCWQGADGVNSSAPRRAVIETARWSSTVGPNPSRGEVDVYFSLRAPAWVDASVFDLAGRAIARLVNGRLERGPHQIRWDQRSTPGLPVRAGWYVVQLRRDGVTVVRHRILLLN